MNTYEKTGGRVQLLLTRNPKIADSGPAGKDFNPACPEPRRVGHPDERTASSAHRRLPRPCRGVSAFSSPSTFDLQLKTYN